MSLDRKRKSGATIMISVGIRNCNFSHFYGCVCMCVCGESGPNDVTGSGHEAFRGSWKSSRSTSF